MVSPVEDDEVADQAVDVPDPVAHLGALIGRIGPQRGGGKRLVEIFANRSAFVQRLAVMDERRDHAERVDLQIFRRVMLQPGHIDHVAFIGEALLLKAQPDAARSARTPAVVKDHHGLPPEADGPVFLSGSVVPCLAGPGQGPQPQCWRGVVAPRAGRGRSATRIGKLMADPPTLNRRAGSRAGQ
jgi:hypothetical protein